MSKHKMHKSIDMTGEKYGRLTVLERVERNPMLKGRNAMWLCECECGTKKVVSRSNLVAGNVISCGCARKERFRAMSLILNGFKRNGIIYNDLLCAETRGIKSNA